MDDQRRSWLLQAALIVMTLVVYIPGMLNDYIWDDPEHVKNNPLLHTYDGLSRIWFRPGATLQYYPVTFSSFWLEYQIWKTWPTGYHVVNILLHAAIAVMLFRALRKLDIMGAWFIAAVFTLHPVHVESVAWITERKNTLSGLFYFCSLLAYLRFTDMRDGEGLRTPKKARPAQHVDEPEKNRNAYTPKGPLSFTEPHVRPLFRLSPWGVYFFALLWFICALLSKSITCSLPAVILLIIWWKSGRLDWRNVWPVMPMFAIGIAFAFVTIAMERNQIGADFDHTFIDRVLIAGRVVTIYASKLVWPHPLAFFYPLWTVDASVWWQYLFPAGVMATCVALFLLHKRIGRGPLVAVLIFVGTLFPAMGFIDVYPMQFSFVADHFQYLASIGLITLIVGAVANQLSRRGPNVIRAGQAAGIVVLIVFGTLSWQQCYIYKNEETLWRDTLAKNPNCTPAHNNLAIIHFKRASATARAGGKDRARKEYADAENHFNRVIAIDNNQIRARNNLSQLYIETDRISKAIALLRESLEMQPNYAGCHNTLGLAFMRQDRLNEAAKEFQRAIDINEGNYPEAHYNLGLVRSRRGDVEGAIESFDRAIRERSRMRTDYLQAYYHLAMILVETGRLGDAVSPLQRCFKSAMASGTFDPDPEMFPALYYLSWIMATHQDEQYRNGKVALMLAKRLFDQTQGRYATSMLALAAAYAEIGEFSKAISRMDHALGIARKSRDVRLKIFVEEQMKTLRERKPIRGEKPFLITAVLAKKSAQGRS